LKASRNRLEISDLKKDQTSNSAAYPADGYLLISERVGNFEWWYFDCMDIRNNCMLKIVVHLGTDPLRRSFFPKLAISIKTPDEISAIELSYQLKDFRAQKERCDIRLQEDCHIFSDSDHSGHYHIEIHIPGFSASLDFAQAVPPWVPPAQKMKAFKGRRQSELFWNVSQPRAIVDGSFTYNNATYALNDAIGYHDHNYWQLNSKRGLYMDEVINQWKWGKCVAGPYTVVFMETRMRGGIAKSIMVAEHDKIVYSTHEDLTIAVNQEIRFRPLKSKYPSELSIGITDVDFPLELVLSGEELIESKDLLQGISPFIAWLIKNFVARPAYFGITCTAELKTPKHKLTGIGNYEFMLFRNTG
jgi:hypothetical protein